MVGASLACALAPTNLRTAVVEANPYNTDQQPSYDDRVLAIAQGSTRILRSLGVWSEIPSSVVTPIKTIHISDRGHFGSARLYHHDHGVEALGYTISARELGQALIAKLKQNAAVKFFCPARIEQYEIESNRVVLSLGGVDQLSCHLVVFADGSDSEVRHSLKFEAEAHNYNQSAVLTTVTPRFRHNNVAFERFTDTGPLALLPSVDNKYAVVWTALSKQADELLHCTDEDFLGRLQVRFGDRVGTLSTLGKRRQYPLSFLHVDRPFRPRVVIVGNAAHTVHPVAGQGFNLGLRDVSTLAEVVHEAKQAGMDIGATEVLDRYWQWRRRDVSQVARFTNGLIRVFTSDYWPTTWMRDSALLIVDLIPWVQRSLVTRTMGLNGRLPRLSRGLALE